MKVFISNGLPLGEVVIESGEIDSPGAMSVRFLPAINDAEKRVLVAKAAIAAATEAATFHTAVQAVIGVIDGSAQAPVGEEWPEHLYVFQARCPNGHLEMFKDDYPPGGTHCPLCGYSGKRFEVLAQREYTPAGPAKPVE